MNIPISFDYEFYRRESGEEFGAREEAFNHFVTVGKQRGLKGSPGCDQGYFLRMIQQMRPESVLEIGPGSSPRLSGSNVYYFDVKTEEELRQRYRNEDSVDRIPDKIHFVHESGDLSVIERRFDVVFSSHVIEHSVDLVAHLSQVKSVLNEGGHYFLVVPNKNYTFDYFKPHTVIEDVLAAHLHPNGSDVHFLKSYLLEEFRRAHNDAKLHWAANHGMEKGAGSVIASIERSYQSVASRPVARSGYHRWIFDEESFIDIIDGLYKLGISPFKVRECYNTVENTMSFNAILSLP